MVLLLIVGFDLTIDSGCDLVLLAGGPTRLVAAGAHADDTGSAACAPDCFCCSRKLVSLPALLAAMPLPATMTAPPARASCADGIRRVPYRPPLFAA